MFDLYLFHSCQPAIYPTAVFLICHEIELKRSNRAISSIERTQTSSVTSRVTNTSKSLIPTSSVLSPFRMLKQAWRSDSLPLRNHGEYNSTASNASSVSSNARLAIHQMLNPILHSSANTRTLDVHRHAGPELPPLHSVNLPSSSAYPKIYHLQSSTARIDYPPLLSSMSPRDRHLFKRIGVRQRSPNSSTRCSVSPLSSLRSIYGQYPPIDSNITSYAMDHHAHFRHKSAHSQSNQHYDGEMHRKSYTHAESQQRHSNKKYTTEEMHFIQYFREDKRMQWSDIVGPFNAQFPNHRRQRNALESRYYRFQVYPKVNEDGTFQYDDKGEIVMVNIKVRDRKDTERSGGKKWTVLNNYVNLVSSCPKQVLEYAWTDVEDKERARAISELFESIAPHGRQLKSSQFCCGVARVFKLVTPTTVSSISSHHVTRQHVRNTFSFN